MYFLRPARGTVTPPGPGDREGVAQSTAGRTGWGWPGGRPCFPGVLQTPPPPQPLPAISKSLPRLNTPPQMFRGCRTATPPPGSAGGGPGIPTPEPPPPSPVHPPPVPPPPRSPCPPAARIPPQPGSPRTSSSQQRPRQPPPPHRRARPEQPLGRRHDVQPPERFPRGTLPAWRSGPLRTLETRGGILVPGGIRPRSTSPRRGRRPLTLCRAGSPAPPR